MDIGGCVSANGMGIQLFEKNSTDQQQQLKFTKMTSAFLQLYFCFSILFIVKVS